MKKFVLLSLGIIASLILACYDADASPYKGKAFPSDQQIQNSFEDKDFLRLPIGKYKNAQGIYNYYFYGKASGQHQRIFHLLVFQLDNGMWLMTGTDGGIFIIQE